MEGISFTHMNGLFVWVNVGTYTSPVDCLMIVSMVGIPYTYQNVEVLTYVSCSKGKPTPKIAL